MSIMRTPLGRARGTGSSRDGAGHHWLTNVTAVGLIPLSLWFVCSLIGLVGADYITVTQWIGHPANASLMLLTLLLVVWHAQAGVQEVIVDYVHCERLKMLALIAVKLIAVFLGIFMGISIIKIAAFTFLQAVIGG